MIPELHQMATNQSCLFPREQHLLLDGLQSRRSVHPRRLLEPGPDREDLRLIISSAATAIDHCALRPWRFIEISGVAREKLAEIFIRIKLSREPDLSQVELERERDRAVAVPVMIAVVCRLEINHPVVPATEQYASVGAAIQSMLLCIHALGFGAKMVSGRKVSDPSLANAFELGSNESLVGFVCIGTPTPGTRPKQRPAVDEIFSHWNPELTDR